MAQRAKYKGEAARRLAEACGVGGCERPGAALEERAPRRLELRAGRPQAETRGRTDADCGSLESRAQPGRRKIDGMSSSLQLLWAKRTATERLSIFARASTKLALLRGSSGTHESPGPIRSAWELSLAGAVVPDIWRPPYICRDPARSTVPTATAALFSRWISSRCSTIARCAEAGENAPARAAKVVRARRSSKHGARRRPRIARAWAGFAGGAGAGVVVSAFMRDRRRTRSARR